jgi:hypothetical protein
VIDPILLERFNAQFDDLIVVAKESNGRLIKEPPDELFSKYLNVFIKSYLVSACSILEAFIQDLAFGYVEIIRARVISSNLPHNIVLWSASKDGNESAMALKAFELSKGKKDISDMVSGNYHKTLKAFARIGVGLDADPAIQSFKDIISSTVAKRNKIVHHNDDASDLSLTDIVNTTETFKAYAECLFRVVCASPHIIASPADTEVAEVN